MGLEAATHISDLVITNPTGADDRSTADDHLRLIKSVLKTDFAAISGAVTATHTELNILDSDGTLLFSHGKLIGGSALTKKLATKHNKPCLHVDLDELSEYKAMEIVKSWIDIRGIKILNVAGPRASESPGIYDSLQRVLKSVLK